MTHNLIFGILSTLVMLTSRGIYFTSILKGKTKPHSFSWFIWGVISSIGFAAQFIEGAGPGSWARGFGAATCFVFAALGLRHAKQHIRRADWIVLVSALAAIPLWVMTKTPVWSVILVCIIDTVGYIPTWRKAWHKPQEEAVRGFAFSSGSAFLSLLAIEHYNLSTWLYSAVLTLTNGGTAAYLILRRKHAK